MRQVRFDRRCEESRHGAAVGAKGAAAGGRLMARAAAAAKQAAAGRWLWSEEGETTVGTLPLTMDVGWRCRLSDSLVERADPGMESPDSVEAVAAPDQPLEVPQAVQAAVQGREGNIEFVEGVVACRAGGAEVAEFLLQPPRDARVSDAWNAQSLEVGVAGGLLGGHALERRALGVDVE